LPFADRVFYMNEGQIIKVVVNEEKKEIKEGSGTTDIKSEGKYASRTTDKHWRERDEYEKLLDKITMSRKQLAIIERRQELMKHKNIDEILKAIEEKEKESQKNETINKIEEQTTDITKEKLLSQIQNYCK